MIDEPYDPLPDLIARAEHRPGGVQQLKDIAALRRQITRILGVEEARQL